MTKEERIQAIERIISNMTQEPHLTMATSVKMELAAAIEEAIGVNEEELRCNLISQREDVKRKPDYIFVKEFYPSSGVERVYEQDKQMTDIAKAISNNKEIIKIEKD